MTSKMNNRRKPGKAKHTPVPTGTTKVATSVSTDAPVEKPAELIPFTEAVREAKKALGEMSKAQWRLGELADTVRPDWGESTLEKFAKLIGIPFKTAERYRDVWRKWKDFPAPGRELPSYAVARALEAVPNRADFVIDKPQMSKREAEEIAKEWRKHQQQQQSAANGGKQASGDAGKRVLRLASEIIELLEKADVTTWKPAAYDGGTRVTNFRRAAAALTKVADALEQPRSTVTRRRYTPPVETVH